MIEPAHSIAWAGGPNVASGVDLPAVEGLQLLTDDRMVAREEGLPAAVPEQGRALGGAHDVGEEHRRELALGAAAAVQHGPTAGRSTRTGRPGPRRPSGPSATSRPITNPSVKTDSQSPRAGSMLAPRTTPH